MLNLQYEVIFMTTKKAENCGHPQLCPEGNFRDRIKTDKLSLAAPPPAELVKTGKGKSSH